MSDDLDTERKLRLLEMTFVRVIVSAMYTTLVGCALIGIAIMQGFDWHPVALWTIEIIMLLPAYKLLLNKFRKDLVHHQNTAVGQSLESFHRLWHQRVQMMAALLGILVGILTFINREVPSFEFLLLIAVIIAIMMATNSAHQTPVLSIYYTYYCFAWGGTMLTMPWVFPDHWVHLTFLALIHSGSTAVDARRVNRFFIHQVALEQQSQKLAEKAREAELSAINALQSKNEFLATASHDLRQPLHALNLNVEAFSLTSANPEQRAFLQDIRYCARTLTQMFNAILDLSKLESDTTRIQRKAINLNNVLSDMARVFSAEAHIRGLDFRLRLPSRAVIIESDDNLIRQIVTNLLQNAMRYTPHGSVLLALRASPVIRIDVIDTGVGIAASDQSRIHQPFYRAGVGFSDSLSSHGLGLAVVARCAKILNADHGFRSVPGRGSRFWVRFPSSVSSLLSAVPAEPPTYSVENIAGVLQGDKCLILEDDSMVAQGWEKLLRITGLEVEVIADHKQLEELLSGNYQPDYALCDLRLRSGDNGYTLLQQIMRARPGTFCALVSGELSAQELADAADDGVPVLQKPVDAMEIIALLRLWRSMRLDSQTQHPQPLP